MLNYLRSGSPITRKPQSPATDASQRRHSYQYSRGSSSGERNLFSRASLPVMSPLSAVENLMDWSSPSKVYKTTPVKAVEDEKVFVMDAVKVSCERNSTNSTTNSYSSSAKSPYRTEIFRFWEDSGNCRLGSKCEFGAHGKEDLRPTRLNTKNKTEAQTCRSITSTPSPKHCCLVFEMMSPAGQELPVTKTSTALTTPPATISKSLTTASPARDYKIASPRMEYWSPQDDGIKVILPHSSRVKPTYRSDVNSYIDGILYGSSSRKRLPVFVKICV